MTQSLKDTIQEINSRYAAALSQPGAPGSEELIGCAAPRGHKGTVIAVFLPERFCRRDAARAV